MKIVICGGRDFEDYELFSSEMANILQDKKDFILVSGGATGADTLASRYAQCYGYTFEEYLADWKTHGKKAGILRNIQMLDVADMVVAFWDGKSRGTAHMVQESTKRNIPLIIVNY